MFNPMDIGGVLGVRCEAVEPVLKDYARVGDERMQEMVLHPIEAGGKRIRPCLTLLACEAVGGESGAALPAAASVELLHTFTLIHDDIMDHDSERRGRPTVHSVWGEEMGIIVGDTLYSTAFKALLDVRRRGVGDTRVLDAVEALVEANGELQEGQIMDMFFEERESVSEEEYTSMIRKKTGALIEAAVKIGCIVGGGSKEQLEAFKTYGNNIGLAFQVKDDVLDLTADGKDLGKPVGSDVRAGKKTLVMVHALENSGGEDKNRIQDVLGRKDASDEEVKAVVAKLRELGSIAYAEERVSTLIDEGKAALDVLPDSDAKESLLALADYLVSRNK